MLNPHFRDMLSALNAEGVEYLMIGAYALAAHGVPRATGDLDLWIRPSRDNVDRLFAALREFGAPIEGLSVEDLIDPDTVVQIGREPVRIDFLAGVDGVEFEEAWENRTTAEIDGLSVTVIGLDDFIRNKRAVGRPRDLADVRELEEGRRAD